MPLSLAVSTPALDGRENDVRALRWRVRTLTSSGTYAAGGDVVTAQELGLRRIVGALNLGGVAAASTPTTAEVPGFIVAADGLSMTVRLYETGGAVNGPLAEKGAEAVLSGQAFNVVVIGY